MFCARRSKYRTPYLSRDFLGPMNLGPLWIPRSHVSHGQERRTGVFRLRMFTICTHYMTSPLYRLDHLRSGLQHNP